MSDTPGAVEQLVEQARSTPNYPPAGRSEFIRVTREKARAHDAEDARQADALRQAREALVLANIVIPKKIHESLGDDECSGECGLDDECDDPKWGDYRRARKATDHALAAIDALEVRGGCCSDSPGANVGCCPDRLSRGVR